PAPREGLCIALSALGVQAERVDSILRLGGLVSPTPHWSQFASPEARWRRLADRSCLQTAWQRERISLRQFRRVSRWSSQGPWPLAGRGRTYGHVKIFQSRLLQASRNTRTRRLTDSGGPEYESCVIGIE